MSLARKSSLTYWKLCVLSWEAVTPRTIARCFRHAGFINPEVAPSTPKDEEEENLPLSELAQRLNSAGRVTEHGRPFTEEALDAVLNEDEGLQTTGLPTDEEIVDRVLGQCNSSPELDSIDEEPEQEAPKRISHKQLMEAINVVEGFFVYQHGKDAEEMHLSALKMQAWAIRHPPKSSQTSLDQFFVQNK